MTRAVGAVVAHFPDTEGVTSSNLVSPTKVEAIRLDITEEPSIRAIGAAASALRSHRRGRRFDSYIAHWIPLLTADSFADIAELVKRNLANVETAGSSPVVRSTTKPRFGEVFSYWFRCWWYLSHAQPIVSYVD